MSTEFLDHCGHVIMFVGTFDIDWKIRWIFVLVTGYKYSREALVIIIIIILFLLDTLPYSRNLKNYWTDWLET